MAECKDTVKVGQGDNVIAVTCSKPQGHPVVGINHPTRVKKYAFHEGDGWAWDESCAWKKGEEPGPT